MGTTNEPKKNCRANSRQLGKTTDATFCEFKQFSQQKCKKNDIF